MDAPEQDPSPAEEYYSRGIRERYHLDGLEAPLLETGAESYADIGYEFDEEMFKQRTERRLLAGNLETHLPPGFPASVSGPMAWSSADFAGDSDYVYHLTESDKIEIQSALEYFLTQGKRSYEVDSSTFPLPELGKRLAHIRDDIYQRHGFSVLRGLDVDFFSDEELTTIYLGLTSYVGEIRGKQNQGGMMMMHILSRDDDSSESNKVVDKPFHNDTVCDVVALLTRECAAVGGSSLLSSAWTVYNELAATRPDLIHVLAEPDWPFDTNGRQPSYYRRPLLFFQDGRIIMNFSRRLLTGNPPTKPRSNNIPGLTEAQAEALDAVHAVARNHELKVPMKKGDIRLFNNMGLLHRRETFEDSVDAQRHLMRLWIHNEQHCWKLPAPLQLAWARIFEDDEREERWEIGTMNDGDDASCD